MLIHFLLIAGVTAAAMLVGAGVCHLVPMLGSAGRRVAVEMCRAPGLDLLVTYFTILPLIVGPIVGGWAGLAAGIVGQVVGMLVWQTVHELVHREAVRGPRIVKALNRKVGALRNYTAVWWTAVVTPCFWLVRMAEVFVYPPLVWLVRLPPYRSGDWVNVSRQKFSGLVGHDLIWCLYCDWMTGVWSLGTEMLRNVESFWCPIRFYSEKKCENCAIDFPDINGGWADASGTMGDVVGVLDRMFPEGEREHAWFGHRVRLTVKGEKLAEAGERTGGLVG